MSKVVELFGISKNIVGIDWGRVVGDQRCPFQHKRCYKVRKSQPDVSIGTCTVLYGNPSIPTVICPARLLERGQIFIDCLHLLTQHEPGNELHLIPEISIPGGSVDYFLVSTRNGRVRDFVGIELQTLDTTGTVWPERQRLLLQLGISSNDASDQSEKNFGMNWKMTAKTILVQLHHKIETFEHINKKLVLVVQDCLLAYMKREFNFSHLNVQTPVGDSVHLHAYRMDARSDGLYKLVLDSRLSTDAVGIAACLGLQAEAGIELDRIIEMLQPKISTETLFSPVW